MVCFVTFHFIDEEGPVGTLSYSTSLYPSTLFRTFFLLLRSRVKNVNVKTKQPHFIPSNKNINYPFNTFPFFQTNERALPVTLKRLVLLDFFSFVPFWHLVLLFLSPSLLFWLCLLQNVTFVVVQPQKFHFSIRLKTPQSMSN